MPENGNEKWLARRKAEIPPLLTILCRPIRERFRQNPKAA